MGLDSVELVMAIEEKFDISIPDEDAAKLETVGKLYHYILENHNETLSDTYGEDFVTKVWDIVKNVIVYQLRVEPEQVTEDANFVYDLGID